VRGLPSPSRFSTGADVVDEELGGSEADSNHVGVKGEGRGSGTRGYTGLTSPSPPRPMPPVEGARRVEEREKEDGRVVEKKLEEARNWPMGGEEARHIFGGGEGKFLGRVDDGPMEERV
jgi:hypothetical protein